MKKYIHIIIYLLLAVVAILVFTKQILDTVVEGGGYRLDLVVTQIKNPFVVVLTLVLPLLYALIYMVFSVYKVEEKALENQDVLEQTKTVQEIIEEEIQNRYQGRIEAISGKVRSKVDQEADPAKKAEKALWAFCNELSLSQGLFYKKVANSEPSVFQLAATFAYIGDMDKINRFELGVGINGQVAYSGEPVFIDEVPSDYLKVISGLGESNPTLLLVIPIKNKEGEVAALLEVSGFGSLNTKEVQSVYEISSAIFSNILI